jgi:hypothetical protein
MIRFFSVKVSIAPINSSEQDRLIYYEPLACASEVPENDREVIRWVDFFEDHGVDFELATWADVTNVVYYPLYCNAYIEYSPEFNTGFVKYSNTVCFPQEIMLRRENYFMIREYEEVYPSLEKLKDFPINEVIEYVKYVNIKLEAPNNVNR